MSISVWDKPAEMNIAPIPWEFILKAGMSKDKMYQDEVDKIQPYQDKLLNYKSLPGDDQTYLQGAQNKLKDLVNSTVGMKDLTDPLEAKKFLDQARQIGLDPKLLRNQNVLEHYQKQQEVKKDYMGKPDGTYSSQDYAFNKMLNQVVTPGSGGSDKYDLTRYGIGPVGVNLEDERTKYFNQIPGLSTSTPKQLGDWYYNLKTEGISEKRIEGQAKIAVHNYASSSGGRQELSDYNMLLETNPQALVTKDKDGFRVKTATEYLYENLVTTGLERAGISTTADMADALNKGVQDRKDNMPIEPETFNGEYTTGVSANVNPLEKEFGKISYSDNGEPILEKKLDSSKISSGVLPTYEDDNSNKARSSKLKQKLDDFRNSDSQLKGLTYPQLENAYNLTFKDKPQSYQDYSITGVDRADLASKYSNLQSHKLKVIDNRESGDISYQKLTEATGMTGDDLNKHVFDQISKGAAKFSPVNSSGKPGFLVTVPWGQDVRAILVEGSNEAKSIFGKYATIVDKVNNKFIGFDPNVKLEPTDDGVVGKVDYQFADDWSGNVTGGTHTILRVLSKKSTDEQLKLTGFTQKQMEENYGAKFDSQGRLLLNPNADIHDNVMNYFNNNLKKQK